MDEAIDGYETGPDATLRANGAARRRLESARTVILVEGVSDQVAVEVAAGRLGIDLASGGAVVMPIGGAHAIGRTLVDLEASAPGLTIAGLFDAGEEAFVRRSLRSIGRSDVELHICTADLEDELSRAAGRPLIERVIAEQGDTSSFAALQAQPHWRDRAFDDQFRRFLGAGARRKLRYAAALTAALSPERIPHPIQAAIGRRI